MATTSKTKSRTFPLLDRRPSFIGRNPNESIEDSLTSFRNRQQQEYCEGAFETYIPPMPYEVSGEGNPNFKYKALQYYKELLCEWCYAIPHSSQWVVFIEPYNQKYLTSQLINMKEYLPWSMKEDWDTEQYVNDLLADEAQKTIGCIFCMGVSEAGVEVGTAFYGGVNGNNAGFHKAPVTANISEHSPLEMVFKETNCSYSQYVINPWIRLVGHKGLHNRPLEENIKAKITVFEIGQTDKGFDSNVIRKAMVYHDCAPINLNDENLDYEDKKLIQRQVSFIYNYATIMNMDVFEDLDEE